MNGRRHRDLGPWIGWAFLAAVVSVGVEGFQFGARNNVFHVPFVLDLHQAPQFTDNAFYGTLSGFVSGFWVAVRPFVSEENVEGVFLAVHLLTRWALLAALGVVAAIAGVRARWEAPLFLLVIVATPLLGRFSVLGGHDLFPTDLSHTTLANALAIGSLAVMVMGSPVLSGVGAGLTFDLNAFVGIWLTAPLLLLAIHQFRRSTDRPRLLRRFALGGGAGLVTAAPVLLWIAGTISGTGSDGGVGFGEFLRGYYPAHFFIDAQTPGQLGGLLLLFASVPALAWMPLHRRREWLLALVGLGGVLLVGIVLPYVSDSRMLLNLHLLRVTGLVQLLLVALVAAAGIRLLLRPGVAESEATGILAVVIAGAWALVPLGLAVPAGRRPERGARIGAMMMIAAAVAIVTVIGAPDPVWGWARAAVLILSGAILVTGLRHEHPGPAALGVALMAAGGGWAVPPLAIGATLLLVVMATRESGGRIAAMAGVALASLFGAVLAAGRGDVETGLVLLLQSAGTAVVVLRYGGGRARHLAFPPRGTGFAALLLTAGIWLGLAAARRGDMTPRVEAWKDVQAWARVHTDLDATFLIPLPVGGFQLGSRREVWVDWKQGAATMWDPSFHDQWKMRLDEVAGLTSEEDHLGYGCERGLTYAVLDMESTPPSSPTPEPRYSNAFFRVIELDERVCAEGTRADGDPAGAGVSK